jgi:hypothetical protein
MNPFNRQTSRIPVPTVELVEVDFNGNTNRYCCRVRVNGGPSVVSRIAQGYALGGVVHVGGRDLMITSAGLVRGSDPNQLGKTILEFEGVDIAQVAAGLNQPAEGNMRSARTGKMTDGARAVSIPASFGPTKRKLVL